MSVTLEQVPQPLTYVLTVGSTVLRVSHEDLVSLKVKVDSLTAGRESILARIVQQKTCLFFDVGMDALLSDLRTDKVAGARMVAMWTLLQLGLRDHEIGPLFKRDRTTVRYAQSAVEDRRATDSLYKREVDLFLSAIRREWTESRHSSINSGTSPKK